MSNPGTRWTDPVTARRVPSKLKKGNKGESARGDKKQGECAMYIVIYVRVYKEWLKRLNEPVVYIHNNNLNECC
jgi:hypothetical protein